MSNPLWFIALLPPSHLRAQITQIKQDFCDRYQSCAALRSPPHITLYPPFPWPREAIAEVKTVLQTLTQSRSRRISTADLMFPIQLQGYGAFPPRVIYIHVQPNPALNQLQQDLVTALDSTLNLRDPKASQRPYRPHLTVAFRDLRRSHFHQAWSEYRDRPFQAEFQATHLTLLYHNQHRWICEQDVPLAADK
ncbi:2'-5' RNA ligase family protein [Thermosynechococcaceae cyanobacterium Okahandja]